MSKYKLIWFEYHNPLNWGKTEKAGIKEMKKLLPAKDIHLDPYENDGWVECECELSAKTLRQAIKLAEEQEGAEVFSILKDGKVVFTEEDLEKEKNE